MMVILRVASPPRRRLRVRHLTVKLDVPAAVGVPEITPVEGESEARGNAPVNMLHV